MTLDREYFESDNQTIGYRCEGYRDFGWHHKLAKFILERKPSSVLDIGGARGYVAKILQNNGVKVSVMDRSEHCYNTRAIDDFHVWDMENTPYPFKDNEFDLVYSNAASEHTSLNKLDSVIREIGRIGKRSYHNTVPLSDKVPKSVFKEDSTHKIYKSQKWWSNKFKKLAPDHQAEIYWDNPDNKNVRIPGGDGKIIKINIGCGFDMFYYGWINIDTHREYEGFAKHEYYKYITADYSLRMLLGDNLVDLIFISNVGTLPEETATNLLCECYRVLKPGGVIRVVTADAKKIFSHYIDGTDAGLRHIVRGIESSETTLDDVMKLYIGCQNFWDSKNLKDFLEKFGFEEISQTTPFKSRSKIMEQQTIVKYPDISLVMEATKGGAL